LAPGFGPGGARIRSPPEFKGWIRVLRRWSSTRRTPIRFWSKPADSCTQRLEPVLFCWDAVSANHIWTVGQFDASSSSPETLTEHWYGTSWSIVSSPSPSNIENYLYAVTALSDGTVVAVGTQRDNTPDEINIPLILQI
jgi:hypothetical protein